MMESFEKQLHKLHDELNQLGELVCDAIDLAINSFKTYDLDMARRVVESDTQIDSVEKLVEARALKLLLENDLKVEELRMISTALKVITDMERIGDQAADIAEILLYYKKGPMKSDLSQVFNMAELAREMVRGSIEAFTNQDLGTACRIIKSDDEVDSLFSDIRDSVIDRLVRNRDLADEAVDIIMITKYLERIGDHATNIGEWTIFAKTGKHKEHKK